MTKKTPAQPLSDNTRKLIIIIAIVLVAVIILSIALALILKPDEKKPADDKTDNSNSSTLAIKNGDFFYTSSDDTNYPRTAVNWTKYGYKAPTASNTHDFESITSTDKTVMGIINVKDENWDEVKSDLSAEGISINNPKTRKDLEDDDDNIYMIYNKVATAASILSDSASVSSGASIKITLWLNLSQMKDGEKAVVMIQKSTVSALKDNWYAYNFEIKKKTGDDVDENGWQKEEFYIFNREASTKYIRVSVGLGNVYQDGEGTQSQGALFIDDITYETVTANDYRDQVDTYTGTEETEAIEKPFQIIENEDITDESKYFELAGDGDTTIDKTYTSSKEYVDDETYSPFTKRDDFERKGKPTDFTISKITQNGEKVIALRLNTNDAEHHNGINLQASPIEKDHYHISFWVRVLQKDGHAATLGNIYVQKWVDDETEWEDIEGGSFTDISTNQEIDKDTNCGWVKYDIYLKPSTSGPETISILFVLGDVNGYEENDPEGMVPQGSLYVTSPAYEKISYKDYNNASSGTYVKKLNLIGDSATTSITNGSFSDVNNIGNEPTSWTPVFAGDNAIYKDGQGNKIDNKYRQKALTAGSGVVKTGSAVDDSQNGILNVTADKTNFGYISNDITLSSRTVYVFSVMAKLGDGATSPFFYIINNSKERAKAVVARVEAAYKGDEQKTLDDKFNIYSPDDVASSDGWARYYILYVTGNESESVRVALFNGKINAAENELATGKSTIYYDNVEMKSIGSYSLTAEDDDAEIYDVTFSANNGYEDAFKDLFSENKDGSLNAEGELKDLVGALVHPDEDAWKEMRQIPEDTDKDGGDEEEPTTKTPSEVDWGLLMSVISSILLVAALLIVFVIKFFQRKRTRTV